MVGLNLENAIPMRWPSGPLEIARREKTEGFGPRLRQALERWHEPAALEILQNTPIDSLVITWASGLPADTEQWRTAGPLIEAARHRNLVVVGWVERTADQRPAVAAAKSAGLAAVVIRGLQGSADFPVVAWSEREDVPWDSAAPAVAITGNVWPGVNITQGGGDANAGPTSLPWLDSNGWYIQLARSRLRAPLWVAFDPPGKGAVFSAQSYANAIADSEVAGGRWLISLDDDFRASLAEGAAPALQSWHQITTAARFFHDHAEWKSYRSLGLVGVISDFSGANFEVAGEVLNLMARRDLLFRVIWKSQAAAQPFTGLKALLYADAAAPDAPLRHKITEFVEQGGLLIAGSEWGAQGKPAPPDFPTQFDVRALGKGRLAVAREALSDAYQVAVDTQFLLSHRHDLVKIYNAPSSGCTRFTASADSRKELLQCVSYADGGRGGGGLRTIWVREEFGKARLWSIGNDPVSISAERSEEFTGVEYHLPATAPRSYLALEFEA
ncbi:MAG TPA: hypothetical protein VLW65_17745 [Bryobacteraceae bacterium]|nr:hypothetical protein [Bryobacteraceae bacterium]